MTKGTTMKGVSGTVGIDLGDKQSHYCVVASDGDFLEEGKLLTTTAAFQRRFSEMSHSRVVLEVGTHSPWVSRLPKELGHEVVVVDPPGPARHQSPVAQDSQPPSQGDAG